MAGPIAARGFVEGIAGRTDEARMAAAKLESLAGQRFVTSYGRALVHAALGFIRLGRRGQQTSCMTTLTGILEWPQRAEGRIRQLNGSTLIQRDDDKPEVVRARLAQQVPPMLEVIEHYERASKVSQVDGRGTIDEVTSRILEALGMSQAVS